MMHHSAPHAFNGNNDFAPQQFHAAAMMMGVSGNDDGGMGLRAASHVSMENTVDAHEYQPLCRCADCAQLLHQFTQYDLVDAFVARHLKFEADVQRAYGFVPCHGGPHGNVAVRATGNVDAATGEPETVAERSDAVFFHHHRHEMREVPLEIKHKSLARYYDFKNNNAMTPTAAAATTSPSHGGRFGGGAQQQRGFAARRGNHHNHHGGDAMTMMMAPPQKPVNVAAAAHYDAGFASHASTKAVAPRNNNGNGFYHHGQQMAPPRAFVPHNSGGHHNFTPFYTPHDVEMAANSVVFTDAARLGN